MAETLMLKGRSTVGVIFSGGPAPAANAVISSATLNFLDNGVPVIGFIGGYKHLVDYNKDQSTLTEGEHYLMLDNNISNTRNRRGINIQTSRANPGKMVKKPEDLDDPEKTKNLRNVLDAFEKLDIGLLISIGGDDTLRTANLIHNMGMPTLHIPKTIDNDYYGIPWTFGFWTSVDITQKALLNLHADAGSTGSYFIAEIMGRKAGWLTYAAGIAGEAIKMIALEDLQEGAELDISSISDDIVDLIVTRQEHGKNYGVICVAEGLADRLPDSLKPTETDPFGHITLGKAEIGKILAESVTRSYNERTGQSIKVNSKQIGYETRTAAPISYDVVLGSTLGYGAYKLFMKGVSGLMVSVTENFDVIGIPFSELLDPNTLTTKVRTVSRDSDLFKLKKALTYKALD
ncbi:MAG: 6-phosphofructokinase [Spirochaetota bacterium]|nr:6-phosphofructokinase [Spirochaetota bacterium]